MKAASRERLALLGILVLAAVLRFSFMGRQSLHDEEAFTLSLSQQSLSSLVTTCARDVHPPLQLLLLHWWAASRPDEAGARSLSAVAGVAAIWLVYVVGRRLFGVRTGLTASLLGAVAPFHLWYSQEARPYSLLMLATLASIALYLGARDRRVHERSAWIRWSALALVNALGLYLHYFFVMVLILESLLTLATGERRREAVKPFLASLAGSAILFAPWMSALASTVGGKHEWSDFNLARWLLTPLWIPFQFTIGYVDQQVARQVAPLTLGALAVAVALALVGLHALFRQPANRRFVMCYVLVLAGVPLVLAAAVNFALVPKYVIGTFPVYLWILALGVVSIPRRAVAAAMFATLLAFFVLLSIHYYTDPRFARDDSRGMAHAIEEEGGTDELVLNYSKRSPCGGIEFYYRGGLPRSGITDGPPLTRPVAESWLASEVPRYSGIWFVDCFGSHFDAQGAVLGWLRQNCELVWASPVHHRGTRLYHFRVRGPARLPADRS